MGMLKSRLFIHYNQVVTFSLEYNQKKIPLLKMYFKTIFVNFTVDERYFQKCIVKS